MEKDIRELEKTVEADSKLTLADRLQALGFVLALLCALALGPQPISRAARQVSPLQSLLAGLRYVWHDPTVLALIALQAIPAFLIMPYTQLLPIFARDILHTGADGLGTLMMANGVGSVVGAVIIVLLPLRRQGLFLFTSLASLGLLLALFGESEWMPLSIGIMGPRSTACSAALPPMPRQAATAA